MNIAAAEEVLDFWFGRPGDDHHLQPRPEWFRKDPAFDAAIRERFGALIEAALRGGMRRRAEHYIAERLAGKPGNRWGLRLAGRAEAIAAA